MAFMSNKKIKALDLQQINDEVEEALMDAKPRHAKMHVLQAMLRYGDPAEARAHLTDFGIDASSMFPDSNGLSTETINLVKPIIDRIAAEAISASPTYNIISGTPGKEGADDRAIAAKHISDYFWERANAMSIMRSAAKDCVVLGNGFTKAGWNFVEEEGEGRDEEERWDEVTDTIVADSVIREETGDAPLTFDEYVDLVPTGTEGVVLADEPYFAYVSPFDVFVPRDARDINETRWIAQRITMRIDEVMAIYDVSEEDVLPDMNNNGDTYKEFMDGNSGATATRYATLYEFYDMRKRMLTVFQLGADKELYRDEFPYSHRFSPFTHMKAFSDGQDEFWGYGYLENLAPIQIMHNELWYQQIDNARQANSKILMDASVLTREIREVLSAPEHGLVAAVNIPNGKSINEFVTVVENPALSADVYKGLQDLEAHMQTVSAETDFQAGKNGADRMTATAAAAVSSMASLRGQELILTVERACAHNVLLLILLAQDFLSDETDVRITGNEGPVWTKVSPGDIYGEYDVRIDGGSTRPVDEATKRQRADNLIQLLPVLTQNGYDPEPLIRKAMADYGYDPTTMLVKAPQADPEEEERAWIRDNVKMNFQDLSPDIQDKVLEANYLPNAMLPTPQQDRLLAKGGIPGAATEAVDQAKQGATLKEAQQQASERAAQEQLAAQQQAQQMASGNAGMTGGMGMELPGSPAQQGGDIAL